MNHVIIIGNLATDIETRTTQSGITCANFRVAVQRRFADKETGKREADFLSVVAWRQSAEFLAKYAHKGDRVAVAGSIQTRSYDAQDGSKRYVTEIVADSVELTRKGETKPASGPDGFTEVDDLDLPF